MKIILLSLVILPLLSSFASAQIDDGAPFPYPFDSPATYSSESGTMNSRQCQINIARCEGMCAAKYSGNAFWNCYGHCVGALRNSCGMGR